MGTRTFVNQPKRALTRSAEIARSGDIPLLLTVITLSIFGLMMLYSASLDYAVRIMGEEPTYLFKRQVLWLGIGAVTAYLLSHFDYHRWKRLSVLAMFLTIVSLISVLLVSQIRLGAIRTFLNGSIQPSELAKLVTVIYLSVWLYAKRDQLHDIQIGLIPLGIILGGVGGLILLQPDLSAAGTIIILGGILFFLAGADLRQIAFLLVLTIIAAWIVVQFGDTGTGQTRLSSYFEGLRDLTQYDYHVQRSLEAIVNGGFFGLGIGSGITKWTGLPVAPTDSIFAVIAEELGLLGAIMLIVLYGVLVWRGLVIARRAPDMLGTLLATGLAFWIGLEALINMSVIVGLMPFAGNALPFISAGGSSLVTTLAAIGILYNVSRQRGEGAQAEDEWRAFGATTDLRRRNRRRGLSRTRRS